MSRIRNIILEQLKLNRHRFLSGTSLSKQLGISRAAIWKQVQQLRREGYIISAGPRRGYRLEGGPDRLVLQTDRQSGLFFYPVVDSTNKTARELAESGVPGQFVVLAEQQQKGRGRRGRRWQSPPGLGLWFSFLLRPTGLTPAEAAPVTLVTAAVLARRLRELTGLELLVKWPNDLLVNGRKVCGILTELKGEPDHIEYLVVGVGLNVNHRAADFPPVLSDRATSLHLESGERYDRTALFYDLREALQSAYCSFFRSGFSHYRELWKEMSATLGKQVTVRQGRRELRGTALDLDRNGALVIRDHREQLHCIQYGELD